VRNKVVVTCLGFVAWSAWMPAAVTPTLWWWDPPVTQTVDSLDPKFKTKVVELITAFGTAGVQLEFNPGMGRTKLKQHFMYWSWKIAKEGYRRNKDPRPVPPDGYDIDWFWLHPLPTDYHPYSDKHNVPNYVGAAMAMVEHLGLTKNPGSSNKLVEGKASSLVYQCQHEKKGFNVLGKDGKTYFLPGQMCLKDENTIALFASFGLIQILNGDVPSTSFGQYFSEDGKLD
jgi:hypothetical protein